MELFYPPKRSVAIVISITLHAFVFGLIGLYFDFSSKTYPLGDPHVLTVTAYHYPDRALQRIMAQEKKVSAKSTVEKKETKAPDKAKQKINLQQKKATATQAASTPKSPANQGQEASPLITLLHAAIQKHQRYPATALQMGREGRVTLQFTLHSNGTVKELGVIKSSGTHSLDQAAMEAVQRAAPFSQVDQYISAPQDYRIDVVFELTA